MPLELRKLAPSDLPAAGTLSAAAFGFDVSQEPAASRWRDRLVHLLDSDPEGSFVASLDGRLVGLAQAMVRERLWCLSLLTVDPAAQGHGAGHVLFEAALGYGGAWPAGVIVGSNDPRALRLYARAGFELRPTLQSDGRADPSRLPTPDPAVREGSEEDLEALAPISRDVRGAPQTAELRFALRRGARLLRLGSDGFAVLQAGHGVWQLVAREERAAQVLLRAALAGAEPGDGPLVRWITAEQRWAIDVLLDAGLGLSAYGAVCVRGSVGPLHPYLPSPPFA